MSRVNSVTKTIRLIPSTYAVSSTSYLSVSNEANAYANTDSTNYATITNTNASTTSRYYYLRGFNFNDIPSDATINSFTIKIKGYESGLSTSTSYAPRLANGTSALNNTTATSNFGTSTSTITIPTGALTWQQIINYGSNFTIMVYVRRNNRNTTGYFYCYGTEIEVTYTEPITQYQITTSVQSGSTSFSPTSTWVNAGEDGVITINNLSDISTFSLTDNGNNVVSELVHVSGNTYTYTIENISADHALIARTVPAYNVTVRDNSTNITSLTPASGSVTRASQGSNFDVKFLPTNINYIDIYDNDGLVDKSVIETERQLISDFTTLNPSSYQNNTFSSSGNLTNGYNSTSNTSSSARFQPSTSTTQSINYYFNVSSIPENSRIISISCSFRIYVSSTFSSSYTNVQLFSGTTSKSNTNTSWVAQTSSAIYNLSGISSFTREELNSINLKISGRAQRDGRSIYFQGADLYIEYEYEGDTYYIYSAPNIQSARTIRFEDKVKYNITSSSNVSGVSLSPSSTQVYEGNDVTLEIVGVTSPNAFKLKDNGADVTSSIARPISNTYDVITQVSGASYGFNFNSSTGYYVSTNNRVNSSASVARINFHIMERCLVTIEYINYAEASYDYGMFGKVDTAVATDGLTAGSSSSSPSDSTSNYQLAMASNSASAQTITYTIESGEHFIDIKYGKDGATNSNNDSLQWKILNISSGSNSYTYTITNVVGNHTLTIEENTYYSVSGTSTFSGKTISGTSNKVYEGDSITLTLTGITNPYSFTLKDNGVDVTSTIVGELSNAYQITEKVSAATYGFELNDNGYYESTNKGIGNTAAVCRVNFDCSIPYEVTIQYINYAESPNYDYGIFGNIDSALGTTYNADSNTFKTCSAAADNSANPQTLVYTIPAGSHFIDIKYRKDQRTDSYNDSLQWKILDIGPASGVTYTYTINNVSGNHTLILSEKTKYTVTASSSYSGVTASVSNPNPYGGESSTITINNVSDISLISIFDNGVTAITGRFSQSGTTLTYIFENISTNHSISVVEHIYYSLSITNETESSTVTPTGTVSNIDAGESYTITLETSDISIIQVIDNDINKTEDLVHIPAQNDSIVLYINSSSNASSSGYTNFTTSTSYPIANAGDASSDTGNYFRLRSTTSNGEHEVWLNFDTSDLNDIPSNASLTVTCKVAFRVSSTTYISALSVQLYSGNTAKGTATTTRTTTTTAYTLNIGNWTLEELQNARIRVTATHDSSTSNGDVRIYGADLTINYSVPEHYEYTLSDISSNHTIVFLEGAAFTLYSKNNNAWVQVSKVYKKINGNWVEIMNPNSLFESNKIYIRK